MATGRRLESHHRLGHLPGTNRPDVVPHTAVATGVARRPDLVKQPLRRQPGELLEARIDDPRVGIQLVGHRRPRRVARGTRRQVPVQLPRHDPLVDRPATHPEAPRQLGLRDAPGQVVFQQHPRLPSVHPSPAPSLLTTSTGWNAGPSPPTTKVCSFRLPRMGNLQLPPTHVRNEPVIVSSVSPRIRRQTRRTPILDAGPRAVETTKMPQISRSDGESAAPPLSRRRSPRLDGPPTVGPPHGSAAGNHRAHPVPDHFLFTDGPENATRRWSTPGSP